MLRYVIWERLLVILKQARQINRHKVDNFVDMHGYLMCYEAIDTKMREMGYGEGATYFDGIDLAGMAHLLAKLEGKVV